ncbi:MAG: Respiratory nitrate reductase delta chain [Burkholderiaceae bacterium]|nr:MAG: Respiratory nitrate reductase delta chain [Burkholderiaceae bacterium]
MSGNPVQLLRALSALLGYPNAELRAALPEIVEAIREAHVLDAQHKSELIALADEIQSGDELEIESRYVDLFDRGRVTCLNLFEHVHGDGRQRGPAMLELRERYLAAGLQPATGELPDHLPVLLEYMSCCDLAETRDTIGEVAHILRKLGNALVQRHSRYAAIPAALLALGGEKGLDVHDPVPPPEDIDREWEEKPAFAPPEPAASDWSGAKRPPYSLETPR